MPRPRKRRFCRAFEGDRVFKPRSIPMSQLLTIRIDLDEFEALRHCDLDRLDQEEAAGKMGVSRGTVQRLLKSGRSKLLKALVTSSALLIAEENLHESSDSHQG